MKDINFETLKDMLEGSHDDICLAVGILRNLDINDKKEIEKIAKFIKIKCLGDFGKHWEDVYDVYKILEKKISE